MTIIYVHGVKVRSPEHGVGLGKSFERWLAPKISVGGSPVDYCPIYWGDLGAHFLWDLASRPETKLLGMGGADQIQQLGALRGIPSLLPVEDITERPTPGPVLGATVQQDGGAVSMVSLNQRSDFLADLYLLCRPASASKTVATTEPSNKDAFADPAVAGLAAAADVVAGQWDAIAESEASDDARAAALVAAVQNELDHANLLPMGWFQDWMTDAGEALRRATSWPGAAVSTVFGELRPVVNEFAAYFVGDVFTYLSNRGTTDAPGEIPGRVLAALRSACERKKQTGEKIVIISHSMGGQLIYDALTAFAEVDPTLAELEVDHWITCGSQVSLFAEMTLFLNQCQVPSGGKLPQPKRAKAWTNFYDVNDPFGFVMSPVFEGARDVKYETGYGLALAHTGFLARPSFYRTIATLL